MASIVNAKVAALAQGAQMAWLSTFWQTSTEMGGREDHETACLRVGVIIVGLTVWKHRHTLTAIMCPPQNGGTNRWPI